MSQKVNPNKAQPPHRRPTLDLEETTVTLMAAGCVLVGEFTVSDTARIHGKIKGQLHGVPGSTIILAESGLIEGSIQGETLVIDGCVEGDLRATKKVTVTSTGRVLGNIHAPTLEIEFGATFEGASHNTAQPATSGATS